jgi:hypothetical protein
MFANNIVANGSIQSVAGNAVTLGDLARVEPTNPVLSAPFKFHKTEPRKGTCTMRNYLLHTLSDGMLAYRCAGLRLDGRRQDHRPEDRAANPRDGRTTRRAAGWVPCGEAENAIFLKIFPVACPETGCLRLYRLWKIFRHDSAST